MAKQVLTANSVVAVGTGDTYYPTDTNGTDTLIQSSANITDANSGTYGYTRSYGTVVDTQHTYSYKLGFNSASKSGTWGGYKLRVTYVALIQTQRTNGGGGWLKIFDSLLGSFSMEHANLAYGLGTSPSTFTSATIVGNPDLATSTNRLYMSTICKPNTDSTQPSDVLEMRTYFAELLGYVAPTLTEINSGFPLYPNRSYTGTGTQVLDASDLDGGSWLKFNSSTNAIGTKSTTDDSNFSFNTLSISQMLFNGVTWGSQNATLETPGGTSSNLSIVLYPELFPVQSALASA